MHIAYKGPLHLVLFKLIKKRHSFLYLRCSAVYILVNIVRKSENIITYFLRIIEI